MMPFLRPPKPSDPGLAQLPPAGAWARLARQFAYLLGMAVVFGTALGVFVGCFRLVLSLFK